MSKSVKPIITSAQEIKLEPWEWLDDWGQKTQGDWELIFSFPFLLFSYLPRQNIFLQDFLLYFAQDGFYLSVLHTVNRY